MGEVQRDFLLQEGMDNKLGILSKRQRRLILLTLKRGEEKTESDLLFRGGDEMDDAELQLVHNHLPRLEEAGYIDWDRDTGTISKGPRYDEIQLGRPLWRRSWGIEVDIRVGHTRMVGARLPEVCSLIHCSPCPPSKP